MHAKDAMNESLQRDLVPKKDNLQNVEPAYLSGRTRRLLGSALIRRKGCCAI